MAFVRLISERPGQIAWDEGFEGLQIDGRKIYLADLKHMLHGLIYSAERLSEELMLGSHQPRIKLSKIRDIMTKGDSGFSFLDQRENKLSDSIGMDRMLQRLEDLGPSGDQWSLMGSRSSWNIESVKKYLEAKERFLELLMLIFHISGGMPARGTELGSIKFRNSQRSCRNFYVVHGKAFFYTQYHKTRSMKLSSYHIVRYLPRRVGELAVLYLSYIRPFANLLYYQSIDEDNDTDSDFFFCSNGSDESWDDKKLTAVMQKETEARMGVRFGIQVYRQVAHAISHVHVQEAAAGFEREDAGEQVSAWQGGHTKQTSQSLCDMFSRNDA